MLTVLTGRSRRLWPRVVQEIGEALAAGGERLLLLVPGQYTLQAELDLVDQLNLPGFFNIDVLSPSRLMTRVFAVAGSPSRVRIDGSGKAMMLADVLRQAKRSLQHYGGAAERRGFADRLAAAIGDFKRAGMLPEEVAALAEALPPGDALRGKLSDIALLYEGYEERLSGAFLDGEDAQEALLERLPGSGLLAGARVWVYGFDLITPQFARQIAVMARGAESVRLALTCVDETERDGAAFTPARDTLARLARVMDGERLTWARERVEAALPAAPAIVHLERELFAVPPVQFDGDAAPVTLWAAKNPYDEAMRTASAMLVYARKGLPFEQMAVVAGNAEAYAGAIDSAFARSGIPYHLARQRPALAHPLPRALLAALRCVTKSWRAEDALDWLKGGFSGLTRDEAERLENYAIENGLRGAKWRRSALAPEMDALRARFVAPLETLQIRLRDAADNTGTLAAVWGLLTDVDAYRVLDGWQRDYAVRGLAAEAADCAQAWRILLETLDQLHDLLRGDRQPMGSVAQVIEAGLAAAELGALPQAPGAVQVGQLGHVKLGGNVRVLFLIGMEDGVLRSDAASLLSDAEAARAAEAVGGDAAFGLRGDALTQLMQINLLDTLAAPSERLFISHAQTGTGGEAQRPAAVLKLIRRIFPGLHERGGMANSPETWHAPGVALDALGPALRRAAAEGTLPDETAQAAAWLLSQGETRLEAERVLRRLTEGGEPVVLPTQSADALYAHTRTSVSRLESFAYCPRRHFIDYGLRPKPRREFEVARDETGTFFHRAIEAFTTAAAELPGWPEITREQSDALMDTALAPLVAEWETRPLGDNAMLRATGQAYCRVARRAAWTYARQMRSGGFRTGVVEARFGAGQALPPILLTLPDGRRRWVEGRIDRIDFLEKEGEKWLCVVDYKSGGTKLEPAKLYGGLQIQLMLYLSAALAAYPGVHAAGAFYSRFDDPLVRTDSRDIQEIERQLAKDLRLRGVVLSDVRIVSAIDDGALARTKDITDAEDLAALMRHAHALAEKIAAQIASGEVAAKPARLAAWRACQACDYAGICGFDPSAPGSAERVLEQVDKGGLFERIREGERKGTLSP